MTESQGEGESVRFGDATVEARGEFLKAARERYPDRQPVGVLWNCGPCGTSFELKDVLIAEGTPKCPVNGESGWDLVFPPM